MAFQAASPSLHSPGSIVDTPRPSSADRHPFDSEKRSSSVRRALRVAIGLFPFTAVGLTVIVASLATGWYQGIGHLDLVLLMVSFSILVVTVLLAVAVVASAVLINGRFRRNSSRTVSEFEADVPSASGYHVELPYWLPCVDVGWRWEPVAGACPGKLELRTERDETNEIVTVPGRGMYRSVVRRIVVRDVLDLCRVSWVTSEPVTLRVLPHRGKLEQLVPLLGYVSGEDISDPFGEPWGDRVDMRQYAAGDSPRMIMWKIYARSRKVMVRINERAVEARPRGCGYLIAPPEHLTAKTSRHPLAFLSRVWRKARVRSDEASAGIARVVLEGRLLGDDWKFGADGGSAAVSDLSEALDAVARSGTPEVTECGLSVFLEQVGREGFAYCVLFAPPQPGPWLDATLEACSRTSLRIHVLIGVDGVAPELERGQKAAQKILRRLTLRNEAPDSPTRAELAAVVSTLSRVTPQILLVDRLAGRIIGNPMNVLAQQASRRNPE